ncbi:hypothetical protein SAMN04488021_13642 [Paracoccus aminovorans]|uniref:DUF4440 domain-containing protein n=1 Tax=Paracoccus aminovorans TaxID=34004 RepID=A0A1I3D851_9RHOB|nr:hypothetical protein [Paracoccus aminovorans]CQR84967.1 hypothetical protein JCM7685_0383 [Paracoccus aminovorans]SFH82877.1 hypothetical protein SAMN04488021_13642 [Paracoccus aminovorans]
MEESVRQLFRRYEAFFNRSLAGDIDADELAALYAPEFIAASPAGVAAGRNDDQLRQAMAQGYAQYRKIGTQGMRITQLRLSPIDENHCLAHVGWTARYARADLPETVIDFEVHYLVQVLQDQARVFGWVAGDEQALLRRHGIV